MKRLVCLVFATIALCALPAQAKVASQGPNGFVLTYEAEVPTDAKAAFDAYARIGEWWDGNHSYSGDAKNISIDLQPGGLWRETLPNGGFVNHMGVAHVIPGKSLLFHGGLGPLAYMGVNGSLSVKFEAKGAATVVKMSYAVGGYDTKDFKELPQVVDGVLGAGFKRYANYASTGKP